MRPTPEDTLPFFVPSVVFSATFPSSGMTRGGMAYAQPTWEQRTDGSACSSSPLLPTVKATNNENRQSLDMYGMNLGQALGITPLA
jgi:hypothetical protein